MTFGGEAPSNKLKIDEIGRVPIFEDEALCGTENRCQFGRIAGGQVDAKHPRVIVAKHHSLALLGFDSQKTVKMLSQFSQFRGAPQKDSPTLSPAFLDDEVRKEVGRLELHQIGGNHGELPGDVSGIQADPLEIA